MSSEDDAYVRTPRVSWANEECLVEFLGELEAEQEAAALTAAEVAKNEASKDTVVQQHKAVCEGILNRRRSSESEAGSKPIDSKRNNSRTRSRKFWSFNDLQSMVSAHDEGAKKSDCNKELFEEVGSFPSTASPSASMMSEARTESSGSCSPTVTPEGSPKKSSRFLITDAAPIGPAFFQDQANVSGESSKTPSNSLLTTQARGMDGNENLISSEKKHAISVLLPEIPEPGVPAPDPLVWDSQWERLQSLIDEALEAFEGSEA
mmetsp:Transcript_27133/g.55284  ORF Transcript_27133/g.55284 Transcript_27133/m.55284 type:complete len:263 (+) Transcript_27133:186-974(+)